MVTEMNIKSLIKAGLKLNSIVFFVFFIPYVVLSHMTRGK